MLDVRCSDHLAAVRAYADTLGPAARAQFEAKLSYLEDFRQSACVCELFKDFAPYSFAFNLLGPLKADGTRDLWFNGGLIYHAARSNGVVAPEFSVTLNPQDEPHWQVHT